MVSKILLPIDYTDERSWRTALPIALEHAKLHFAKLHVISVFPDTILLPNLPSDYGAGAKSHVRKTVETILAENGVTGLPIHIEEGSVYREILRVAHEAEFDLIVMASTKGFPDYATGPNLSRVVRNTHCNVLVVRS